MSTQHGNAEACELSAAGEQSHDLLKNIKFPDMHPPTEGAAAPAVQTTNVKPKPQAEGMGLLASMKYNLKNSLSRMVDQVDEGAIEYSDAPVLQAHPAESVEGEVQFDQESPLKIKELVGRSPLQSERKDWQYRPPNW